MQALRLNQWKSDPVLVEVDQPDPAPGQVLVKIGGAGACHSDLHLMREFEAGMVPFEPPFTLGHENAGWVEALGAGVTGLEVGQPVAVYGPWGCGRCSRCVRGMENYCEKQAELAVFAGGLGADGGMAPYMVVPSARHLVPLHDLDPVDAAPLTDAGLTPYHAIKRSLDLMVPGSTTVVVGIGGLGHVGVQIVKALSATRIVAVDSRPDALALASEVGADHTVLAGAGAADEIKGITDGKGADVVLDFVGNEATVALGVAVSRQLGHVTVVGLGGGSYQFGFFTVPYEAQLATTYWGSVPELMEVVALAEAGHIHVDVTRFSLPDALGAYEKLERGELTGRAVVVPS